ncbi:MAG: cobalamin biosynthesis protein CbiD [Clostridiales bacterium]|jgi:cobalt-precorrin-5B (C1)-methyltransferase|nr:cobalamin biosynthesis protein CbiD [Clostridiales bacterium]
MLPVYQQPDGTTLRAGFTTGTCAAAAAAAAVRFLYTGDTVEMVTVDTPSGLTLTLSVELCEITATGTRCAVRKDAGDDPDVTHKLLIVAEAETLPKAEVQLMGGDGVGRVTKPGLAVPPGEAAINPVPRQQILAAVVSVLPPGKGVRVTISVPGGRELAARTLNPSLGILGGISILGTTGIVEPMSSEAFKRSLLPQIDVALAAGHRRLVLTPGKMGKTNARKLLPVETDAVILTSNFIGYMLTGCAAKGVSEVILLGHIGKLVKVAAGITDTHSSVADARRETLVAHAALAGLPVEALRALMAHNTAEESARYLVERGNASVLTAVATEAVSRAGKFARNQIKVGCILLNLRGDVLAADPFGAACLKEWNHG